MFKVDCGPTVFFDVDNTLVMWSIPDGCNHTVKVNCRGYESELAPNKYNIDLLKKMAQRGHAIVVWSGGGADWCEAVIKALGLQEFVQACMGKPQYYIDDKANPKEWIGKHGYFDYNGNRIHGDNFAEMGEVNE